MQPLTPTVQRASAARAWEDRLMAALMLAAMYLVAGALLCATLLYLFLRRRLDLRS